MFSTREEDILYGGAGRSNSLWSCLDAGVAADALGLQELDLLPLEPEAHEQRSSAFLGEGVGTVGWQREQYIVIMSLLT